MVKSKATLVFALRLSATCTVKLKVPALVGVPFNVPVGLRASPSGNVPERTDQVYGDVPPEAVSVCE